MSTSEYSLAARQYVDAAHALFGTAASAITTRSSRSVGVTADLADQAERLAAASQQLSRATSAKLQAPDPAQRIEAETQLLAQALTDLEVSALLLQAAQNEEGSGTRAAQIEQQSIQRSGSARDDTLQILLGSTQPAVIQRSVRAPRDLTSARLELVTTASDTLQLINERAGKVGQAALSGLVGLGMGEVGRAAGIVGLNIADALGQAENVTRLYNLCRDFALKAYDSLLALLGPAVAQTAAKQVVAWLNDLHSGTLFSDLIDKLYETAQTRQFVRSIIEASEADLARYTAAIEHVGGLGAAYSQQIKLAEKLLSGLRWIGSAPAAALPHGKLLLAATYIVLGSYVILAGADMVDAQRTKLLDRTPGVRRLIEQQLGAAAPSSSAQPSN